jgi:hypothetical protein
MPNRRRGRRANPLVLTLALVAAAVSLALAGCRADLESSPADLSRPGAAGTSPEAPTLDLGIDGRTNATPSIAARGRQVVIAWTASDADGSRADVFAAVSDDGGRTFGSPVRVNDVPGTVRSSGEQAPRVAISASTVAVVWSARQGTASAVVYAVSRDGGCTVSPARPVHPAGLTGARGWASIAIDAEDRIQVAWLDGRHAAATDASSPHAHHGAHTGGAMTMAAAGPRQDLFRAVIDASGRATESLVAAGVCFCCKTVIVPRPDGTTFTAWRHIFPESARDIGSAVLDRPSGAPPAIVRVSQDHWHIEACPDDGPAALAGPAGDVHIVWPTLVDGQKAIFYAHAPDAVAFSPREAVNEPSGRGASHPQIARVANRLAVAWDEPTEDGHRVMMRWRNTETGRWSPVRVIAAEPAGIYPSLAASGDGVVMAWTSRARSASRIAVSRRAIGP